MKHTIITVIALFAAFICPAQDIIEKSVPAGKSSQINIDFQFADQIIIKKWDKNEAYVKAIVNINDNEDNEKFSLTALETANGAELKSEIDDLDEIGNEVEVYRHGKIVRSDHCLDMEIDFEIFLPEGAKIRLETISGDIEIIGFNNEIEVKTISGFIDVTIDSRSRNDILMETITGEYYSDLDLDRDKKSEWKNHWIGGELETTLNGGGPRIKLETISGNIYLRKE